MRFSCRLPSALEPNLLTRTLARMRSLGEVLDLTVSNPTRVGLFDDDDERELVAALSRPAAEVAAYAPEPRGLAAAREAIAEALASRHPAERLWLTASTSEAYGFLFKLLCDPGDEVLVPRPSYPLFEHLTALDAVRAVPYRLCLAGVWQLDLAAIEGAITERSRALLVVNPNNPTGSALSAEELSALAALCSRHDLALIGDEVFWEYRFAERADRALASVASVDQCLCFGLGGLSKLAGLPQLKLSWIGTSGPVELVARAEARLEIIADAYLSVGAGVQLAVRELLELGSKRRQRIALRVRENRHAVQRLVEARHPACTLLPADGGWCAVLRVPASRAEEELAVRILESERVLVQPGYFFDFDHGAHLVVSLLGPVAALADGLDRALGLID